LYSIIIPAYNESQRLALSLDKILRHIAEQRWQAEIIVVDDGSTDDTAAIVSDYVRKNPTVRLLRNPGNRGKGYSVRNGMIEARGDILLLTDADLSAPISEAQKLFATIAKGADVAIGSRWMDRTTQTLRQPFYRQVTGRVFNLLLHTILSLPQKDTQCGFKAFSRQAARAIFPSQKVERWGFDAEILFLARRLNFEVAEVPVQWGHDDRSKIHPLRDGFSIVWDMIRVRYYAFSGQYEHVKRAAVASAVGSRL
jgi:glycosyltransferase involved in cell wall biosynthesis